MAILGGWITSTISASTLNSAAKSSSVFVETFLEPYVQDLPADGAMTTERMVRLDGLLADTPLGERLISVKVWRTDGTVIYSTNRDLIGRQFNTTDVRRAASGEIVASYDALDNREGATERATGLPLIEIYAPLRAQDGEIVAVGEYYEHAPWFAEELERARLATWAVVGATTAGMIGILFLLVARGSSVIASQRSQLDHRIAEADLMAAQNENLREAADKARLDASEANEQLLARIGADLHDGPIQMLSLLTLRLSAQQEQADDDQDEPGAGGALIAQDVLRELRTISAGLVLPEIDSIDLRGALQLAVLRHEGLTGTKIAVSFGKLPRSSSLPLKTCAYRVVQEALSNAYKHAGDVHTEVRATVSKNRLYITVSDCGPGMPDGERSASAREQLGLAGIRNRINALKGEFSIEPRQGGGTCIGVVLPLN
ncbi:sensor histidine kinase [Pelagibacterium halotolerans]|uniref:histidine kinase n=2 Tax=Pelagibacterium TaxID=1082930 RepID=G4RB84_PELHB|nr:ATP-binding protein [Pelagibacterium halotolerans]AEQ51582.1 two-component, sensor histidine kinase [Pelagibacterium halotolerans B2]QJR18588.1 sensor histidine kinase [Pelagibacterium halotolerans]